MVFNLLEYVKMSVHTFGNRHFISFRFQYYLKNFSLIKKLYLCFQINQPEEELLKICRPVFTLLKLVKSESYMVDYFIE